MTAKVFAYARSFLLQKETFDTRPSRVMTSSVNRLFLAPMAVMVRGHLRGVDDLHATINRFPRHRPGYRRSLKAFLALLAASLMQVIGSTCLAAVTTTIPLSAVQTAVPWRDKATRDDTAYKLVER